MKIPSPTTGQLVDADPRRFVSLRIRQLLVNGESPLEFLLKQMQDANNSVQFRAYCATQCIAYVHPRAAPEPLDVTDPHQSFLDHVEGLKAQLMGRLAREVSDTPTANAPTANAPVEAGPREAEIISFSKPAMDGKLVRKKPLKNEKEPVE